MALNKINNHHITIIRKKAARKKANIDERWANLLQRMRTIIVVTQ